MKKLLLIASVGLSSIVGFSQTAVNFNCNDCAGNNHDLFTELAAGKVIVITWVMPCGACIGVASSVSNTVQGYASSNPGQVKFYLVDDYSNTNCSTLNSWASTNSISTDANFSNASISMTDYGSTGMQKTIVLGGPNHDVWDDEIGAVNVTSLQNAINAAITAVGIATHDNSISGINLFPNPVKGNQATLGYSLTQNSDVTIDIYNTLGEKVKSMSIEKQTIGKHEAAIDLAAFTNGVYFIKLNTNTSSQTVRFVLTN
jgi:hypothetical protein